LESDKGGLAQGRQSSLKLRLGRQGPQENLETGGNSNAFSRGRTDLTGIKGIKGINQDNNKHQKALGFFIHPGSRFLGSWILGLGLFFGGSLWVKQH